jgi:TrmH family RNA methyltransferase
MIPLYKLEKLPRSQRLRKIAKVFAEAEYRLSLGNVLDPGEIFYFHEICGLLSTDKQFSPDALYALGEAEQALRSGGPGMGAGGLPVRALNTVRHILLAETGRQTADWDFIDHHTGRLDPRGRTCFPGMRVYLEDIRSPFNVGALFRTAESFGAERLYLSPLCADPGHPRAERTAMGCVALLPWERLPLAEIPEPVFALETGGTGLGDFRFPRKGLLIAGSEELGVSPQALERAESSLGRVSIPSYGVKGSLNVSVAFGIVMQAWAEFLVGNEEQCLLG